MLEIPLSEGSKLELHCTSQSFVFAKFLYTSPYTHTFVRVYTCILTCIIIRVYYISNVHVYLIYTRRGFCTLVPSFNVKLKVKG